MKSFKRAKINNRYISYQLNGFFTRDGGPLTSPTTEIIKNMYFFHPLQSIYRFLCRVCWYLLNMYIIFRVHEAIGKHTHTHHSNHRNIWDVQHVSVTLYEITVIKPQVLLFVLSAHSCQSSQQIWDKAFGDVLHIKLWCHLLVAFHCSCA